MRTNSSFEGTYVPCRGGPEFVPPIPVEGTYGRKARGGAQGPALWSPNTPSLLSEPVANPTPFL